MRRSLQAVLWLIVLCLAVQVSFGQQKSKTVEILPKKGYTPLRIAESAELKSLLDVAIKELLDGYPAGTFKDGELAASLIDISDLSAFRRADYKGEVKIYPASVVKLFYMAALERQLEDGKIKMTPELARGLKDMIVDSSNEATQYILDVLTDTSSGAELPQKEFDAWQYKRNRVNRFLTAMGYKNINVNQKTFCEDAYGIEQQSRQYKGQNRNMLTTNATANLMFDILLGRITTPNNKPVMAELRRRDPFSGTDMEDQAHAFTGKMFIDRKLTTARLWSKAGWTSKARHDAAYIETPEGLKFILVVFTENHANDKAPIPTLAGKVLDALKKLHNR